MKENFVNRGKRGFTLIEGLVSIAIFVMLASIAYAAITALIRESGLYRENTTLSGIADQYLEIARNLPYSQVGTMSGNPHGPLPDLANATTTSINGVTYQMYYAVSYVDDPADGTAISGTDAAANDYKQIKFYVKNDTTGAISSFLSTIAPKGLENMSGGGALSIKVFDSLGIAVPYATVNITNSAINPPMNLTRITDASGNWIEVGLPASANSYRITVSKNGYSSDQTYTITAGNPSPTKPDATVLNGQVTQVSFSIDKLSSLTLNTVDQSCNPISESGIGLQGAKIIGTPNLLKFNNVYNSNNAGKINLSNMEWDSYTPSLNSNNLLLYGSSPAQPFVIPPDSTQEITMLYGPKSANSLLVIVKDSVTKDLITSSSINLKEGLFEASIQTGGDSNCHLRGQAIFLDVPMGSNYVLTATSTGYQDKTITGINISGNNLLQVLLDH